MLFMEGRFKTPYYAVIFISKINISDIEFDNMQIKLMESINNQEGFLGSDRYRNNEGLGFSISYWDSIDSIKKWHEDPVHSKAQKYAREKWYSEYVIRTCKVEYDNSFSIS